MRHGERAGSERGQASFEYVGVLLLVAVVLSGFASVARPGVAAGIAARVREGICRVAGGVCSPQQARAEGLEACVVHVRGATERAGVKVAVIRLGRTDALLVERRSDGTGRVTFLDGGQLSGELAAGLRFSALGAQGKAAVRLGVQFTRGEAWEFPSHARAERFAQRWAREEDLSGEARRLLPGGDDPRPPRPAERFREGGLVGDLEADLELPPIGGRTLEAEGTLGAAAVVGRREDLRAGTRTWYLKVDARVAAQLGLVVAALSGDAGSEAVLEYTTRRGRPHELRARAGGHVSGALELTGGTTRLPEVARRLQEAMGGGGAVAMEATVALDLRDPENRRAAAALPALLRPGTTPRDVEASLRALAARLDADGAVDLLTYRQSEVQEADLGAEVNAGPGLGAEYERTAQTKELLRAWSLRHGGALREREDCQDAARA